MFPEGQLLLGAAVSPGSAVAAWSRHTVYLANPSGSSVADIGRFVIEPIGLAFVEPGARIDVVDATRAQVLRLTTGGRVERETTLDLPFRPRTAVPLTRGWVIGGVDSLGYYHVVGVNPSDSRSSVLAVLPPDSSAEGRPAFHLSGAVEGFLLTGLTPPFTVRHLNAGGEALREFAPASAKQLATEPSARWVSLPAIHFPTGYLQTLTDLASNRRMLVLYDETGREMRSSRLEVPVGFIGVTPDGERFVAARNVGSPEIVFYRWRWSTPTQKPGVRQ